MNRREFIRITAGALAYTALGKVASAEADAKRFTRPNILFIMTDQQHAGMMRCTGNRWLNTPAMNGLAREGIRFESAYCSSPSCVPSRTSMATGIMPGRLGVGGGATATNFPALPPDVSDHSLGNLLKQAGYATFYGGKSHLYGTLAPGTAGYDEVALDKRDALPSACLAFMTKKRYKPFFAVASFINPHDICYAHLASEGKDRNKVLALYNQAAALPLDQLPPLPPNYAIQANEPSGIADHLGLQTTTPAGAMRREYNKRQWRIYRWIYLRLTEQVDKEIGLLLAGLKAAGLEDNTVIVFTSDHGEMASSHRLASKYLLYDESVRVPLIIKHKSRIPAGTVDRTHLVASGLDILPTLCDYAQAAVPATLLGRSLRPLAEGRAVGEWRPYVASENDWSRMIRSPSFKYCVYDAPGSKESLVDMENDPGEMRNLVDDPAYRSVLTEHRELLADWSLRSDDQDALTFIRND